MNQLSLTVVIPAYNEEATITTLLTRVGASPLVSQIVVVDDGSTDGTWDVLASWKCHNLLKFDKLQHESNRGKGAAIRTGLAAAESNLVIIQDADLEYNPEEYSTLIAPIMIGKADVVFGSRYLERNSKLPLKANRLCVELLNFLVSVLYGVKITDEATCYKLFWKNDLQSMQLRCNRFEFCPEVTAKACRMKLKIVEVPISYSPRSVEEGKKINWIDGIEAMWTLISWRFRRFKHRKSKGREDNHELQ